MARVAAQQGKAKPKTREAVRAAGKEKPKTTSKPAKGSSAPKAKAPAAKSRPPKAAAGGTRAVTPVRKRPAATAPAGPGPAPAGISAIESPEPPRLLRQTKNTSAALALLEKGIELLFRKEIRKARSEFDALLAHYPAELEIVARARSYLQICDREEAGQKKAPASADELYAIGIMAHNQADYDRAIAHFRKSLEKHPDADYVYYSMAASLAMKGEAEGAIEKLRRAVGLNEDSRVHARNDSDFSALESHPGFRALVGLPAPQASGPE